MIPSGSRSCIATSVKSKAKSRRLAKKNRRYAVVDCDTPDTTQPAQASTDSSQPPKPKAKVRTFLVTITIFSSYIIYTRQVNATRIPIYYNFTFHFIIFKVYRIYGRIPVFL